MSNQFVNIKEFEGYYQSDEYGNIKSVRSNKLLSASTKKPYLGVTLCVDGKKYYKSPHRIVAEHFVPNPENKPEVNHLDGNKHNNYYKNLAWSTKKENKQHAIKTGLVEYHKRIDCFKSHIILDTRTGVFYNSITEAAKYNNRMPNSLARTLNNGRAASYHLKRV